MDGYTSKKESLNEIAKDEEPDIFTLNDTALKGKFKVNVPNYFSFVKNRDKHKGGVATVIANHLKQNAMKVTEGKEEDEYIITRLDHTIPAINIVNIYGQQEAKTSNDDIEKSWLRLKEDIDEIKERDEALIMIGDMNRKIGNDKYGVKNNKSKISHGGHFIRNMIRDEMYILINNLDMVEGGPWTWVDRQDSSRMSCLDLGIMSASLVPYLTKVEVDVGRKFTPRRVKRNKKKQITIFTDHFSLKVELKGVPRRQTNNQQESIWNQGKPGGWDRFENLTNEASEKIKEVSEKETNIDKAMAKLENIDTKIKFQAFGKTKPKKKKIGESEKCRRHRCNPGDICEDCKTQKQKDDDLLDKQRQRIEDVVEKITNSKQGRAGNVFKIRKSILGPKKTGQEASAIRHPKTNELIVSKEEIKKVTLEYCTENLANNTPDEEVKDMINKRRTEQIEKMKDTSGESFEVNFQDFDQVLAKFEMKDTKTYDYLLKAGDKYKYACYKICKRIIDNEEIPDNFRKTILYMIWKRKGQMNILKHNRFLHMKQVLARTVDSMVVNKMKPAIISGMSIYQVGGLPGHSISEHLLTIKTILAMLEANGEGLIFLVMDIISFFDKEDIFDCLQTLEEINVNKKARRLWYLLNMKTRISVKTTFGITDEAEVGDCLGQGTAGAGLVSAANLDMGLQKAFNSCPEVLRFGGDIRIQPLSYQDDVGSICSNVNMARIQATKMAKMIKEKGLEAHKEKSGILILGSKAFRKKTEKELENNPINFGKFNLMIKNNDKYLGQIIESNLTDSALATVNERQGRIKGAAIEVKAIVEDFTMQTMGGLAAAWELWERAIVPSLLSGAGTWLGEISSTIKLCNKIQDFYWRVVIKVPESCPKIALRCETYMTDMKWRIWQEKCLQLVRIQNIEEGSLAKSVQQKAEANGWPGLGKEVTEICRQIGIRDINKYKVDKREIQKAIEKSHYEDMMEQLEGSKKLEDIKHCNFQQMQEYFNEKNIENSRLKFKIRTKMLEKIPGNFKNKYKHNKEGLKCRFCTEDMTQGHCIICPGRIELREGLDMENLDDLVIYFKSVIEDKAH